MKEMLSLVLCHFILYINLFSIKIGLSTFYLLKTFDNIFARNMFLKGINNQKILVSKHDLIFERRALESIIRLSVSIIVHVYCHFAITIDANNDIHQNYTQFESSRP